MAFTCAYFLLINIRKGDAYVFVMRKANKIVRVSEDELERYIYRGFDLVNDKGTIIKNNSELHKELYNEQRAEYFKNQKVAELLKELKKDK